MTKMIPFAQCTMSILTTGIDGDELIFLDIAPTMRSLTYRGKKYNRMPNTRFWPIGKDGPVGGTYLMEGYT